MADSGSSSTNAAASGAPPSSVETVNADAGQNEPRNAPKQTHSGTSNAQPPPKSEKPAEKSPKAEAKTEKSPPIEDDDPEEDIDGEKIKRSELRNSFKRFKDWEKANHAKSREIAELKKQTEAERQELVRVANELRAKREGADPWALHRAAGATDEEIDAMAEQRLLTRMKRAQMTPEQIEAEQIRSENTRLKQEAEQRQEQEKQLRRAELERRATEHWDKQIAAAMETANLSRTAKQAASVAAVMAQYLEAGEQIAPELAARIVRDEHHTSIRHEFTDLRDQLKGGRISQEKFVSRVSDLVGDETVKLLRQNAIKEAQNFEPQKPRIAPKPGDKPKQRFESFDEANAWIEKQLKVKHG